MEYKMNAPITVRVRTLDRISKSRQFKTLAGAQKFAARWVGETPDIGSHYAVSFDGIATLYASVPLVDLFPKLKAEQDELAQIEARLEAHNREQHIGGGFVDFQGREIDPCQE